MPFNVLEAILIVVVAVSLISLALPSIMKVINESMDSVEVGLIKSQFDTCSERILETARSGAANRCFFNINRGELTGRKESLTYTLVSTATICEPHSLAEIDEKRHIWQKCTEVGGQRVFEMLWMFPEEIEISGSDVSGNMMQGEINTGEIEFGGELAFRTVSVYVAFEGRPNESGHIVDLERLSFTEESITLKITIY